MKSTTMIKLLTLTTIALAGMLVSCSEADKAKSEALAKANDHATYIPVNDIEYKNYIKRQKMADDPTTILWCTAFPAGYKPFTIPIVGKTTSGSKRPFDTDPGPDGMYGKSSEYDYGFGPSDVYAEWRGMFPQFCTNAPMIFQREQTTLVMSTDPRLLAAQTAARAALKDSNPNKALQILADAIGEK